MKPTHSPDDALWYKDAVIYEVHLRAFKDSNGDGIGDLAGLIEKLEYIVDLGATAIWLLPFYPSPLRDGGYDIADYTSVHQNYGTREDFQRLLDEAHRLRLKVITELVLNHTSAEHPWFQRARRAPPGSSERNFYVWSDTPKRYESARIIFQDFETSNWSWDPVAKAYYWHRFYSHQPDLNFEHPEVQAALLEVIDLWLEMGVDGMRLDAVPYLYEREDTSCENLPETHAFLRKLRAHVDRKFANRMLLAEANQWPEDAAAYFGEGDECHMNFHFPLMPRMFIAVELEDSFPIVDILRRTPQIHETCQWATFLRNHDELTLEMVTDEDRDTMYRAYASERHARLNLGIRRRLFPLLGVRRKVELMNALLLSLPGTPVLYYGDEIGMGDNIYLGDRDGVRTPMQWSSDRNAGFSRANPQKLYLPTIIDPEFHYEAINVEAQQANASSLLWWMKRLIAKRKEYRVFGRGSIEFVSGDNPRVLGFVREHEGERVLVLANLSRFVQCARLNLDGFASSVPVEVFGRMRFPEITEAPYFVSLGPHEFYWLALEAPKVARARDAAPGLACGTAWTDVLAPARRRELSLTLASHVVDQRWFRGKSRAIKHTSIVDVIQTSAHDAIVLFEVEYDHGAPETYMLPLAFVTQASDGAQHVIATVSNGVDVDGRLIDATQTEAFGALLLETMRSNTGLAGGKLVGRAFPSLERLDPASRLPQRRSTAEQSNSSILFGERFMFKMFRLIAEGPSSEYELGQFLSSRTERGVARLAGVLEYRVGGREPSTIGTLFDFVPNHGDGWQLALDSLDRYFDRLLADDSRPEAPRVTDRSLLVRAEEPPSVRSMDWIGPFLDRMRKLGVRTAELHQVLGSEAVDTTFAPQPFDMMHQQSLYQSTLATMSRTFDRLQRQIDTLPEEVAKLATTVLLRAPQIDKALARITKRKIDALRIRVHGDYHLGQVLWTGDDFVIVDFEGEPSRPLSQRRFKRCPLRDVAGMVRSFHYASEAALRQGRLRAEDVPALAPWAHAWPAWVAASYLGGYSGAMRGHPLWPANEADVTTLLDFYLMEKCIYEIGYELDHRPAWVEIPIRGLIDLAGGAS